MEEVERKAYGKHQDIIQQLTQAKDKVGKLKMTALHESCHGYIWIYTSVVPKPIPSFSKRTGLGKKLDGYNVHVH